MCLEPYHMTFLMSRRRLKFTYTRHWFILNDLDWTRLVLIHDHADMFRMGNIHLHNNIQKHWSSFYLFRLGSLKLSPVLDQLKRRHCNSNLHSILHFFFSFHWMSCMLICNNSVSLAWMSLMSNISVFIIKVWIERKEWYTQDFRLHIHLWHLDGIVHHLIQFVHHLIHAFGKAYAITWRVRESSSIHTLLDFFFAYKLWFWNLTWQSPWFIIVEYNNSQANQ